MKSKNPNSLAVSKEGDSESQLKSKNASSFAVSKEGDSETILNSTGNNLNKKQKPTKRSRKSQVKVSKTDKTTLKEENESNLSSRSGSVRSHPQIEIDETSSPMPIKASKGKEYANFFQAGS